MTQSVVNFVSSLVPVASQGNTLPYQSNVFDYQVSANAQAYYTYNMTQIQNVYQKIQAGTATDADVQQLMSSLSALNNWAGIQQVATSGPNAGTQVAYAGSTSGALIPVTGTTPASFADNAPNSTTLPPGLLSSGNANSSTPANVLDTTMNSYMAQSLENVDGLLSSVIGTYNAANPGNQLFDFVHATSNVTGIFSAVSSATTVLQTLASQESIYQFGNLIASAITTSNGAEIIGNAFTGSSSIQQALAVDFVTSGNEILFNQMTQLNTALNTNQSVLGYLNSLQDLMNQKNPQLFIKQLGQLSSSSGTITSTQYNNYESSTYNATLGTVSSFGADSNLSSYETPPGGLGGLAQGAFATSPPTPTSPGGFNYSAQTLINNLTNLIATVNTASPPPAPGQTSSTSQLTTSLQAIINDLNGVGTNGTGTTGTILTVQDWVQDIQAGNEGQFQTDLNNAISAAQSFNDIQGQTLSNVMFVFQQFYQSASSLLSNMNTLVQHMADQVNK